MIKVPQEALDFIANGPEVSGVLAAPSQEAGEQLRQQRVADGMSTTQTAGEYLRSCPVWTPWYPTTQDICRQIDETDRRNRAMHIASRAIETVKNWPIHARRKVVRVCWKMLKDSLGDWI